MDATSAGGAAAGAGAARLHRHMAPPTGALRELKNRKRRVCGFLFYCSPGVGARAGFIRDKRQVLSLRLCSIMSWMMGVRITSIAKPILPPGTTMVLGRDIHEPSIICR